MTNHDNPAADYQGTIMETSYAPPPKASLLIVDDAPENLTLLSELLSPLYHVRAAISGFKALRVARGARRPDLILLDVMMPGMNGYQVFEHLRADPATRDIPVIFVTALNDPAAELRGLEMGAVDYLSKPIMPPIALARIRNQIDLKQARDWLTDRNGVLEREVALRMADNELVQTVGIRALAHLAETRDPETGNHILRTQNYVRLLALDLCGHARFRATLSERYIELLARSAPLHDIGKVGVPDAILNKPGPLTPEEWTVMKTHTRLGAEAIERAEEETARPVDFLALAKEIARWHHERWDGGGYPDGLAGEAIPVSARLMAVADVFDALISPRVYKPALDMDEARQIIAGGRGTQFDPDVVDAFLANFDAHAEIARAYMDSLPESGAR